MSLTKTGYKPRLIDLAIEKRLSIFGAVSIEGPKWCGKTWTALNHAASVSYMTDRSQRDLARVDPKYIFKNERPQLIDEWQTVPGIWDAVRHECDSDSNKGKFLLTGSTTLLKPDDGGETVFHTGTGRIDTLRMHPMSLFESGDSDGRVGISDMLEGNVDSGYIRKVELGELAQYIVRGGWPANLDTPDPDAGIIPASYIEAVVTRDIHELSDKKRSPEKMRMLIRSLARNESSVAGVKTLIRDIEEYDSGSELILTSATFSDYLSVLDSLYMTENQPAYSLGFRSSARVGKTAKRHLADPSLAAAALDLTVDKLLNDHETFGLLFEALAERDLLIYALYHGARLYHFRDNLSGAEVDAIVEFRDGSYGAFEIKLSDGSIPEAIGSLTAFRDRAVKKPAFMCVITGHLEAVWQDPESGVFVVPLTSLKP
ncbi:MAG: DUF4143 domain-containing protein [Clostridia bacterium]|nr:DUF4143 domain-containing protein [Clostridia bacterium]